MTETTPQKRSYFQHARRDLVPFLPDYLGRILEVGCGEASTLGLLKKDNRYEWACGVELDPDAARNASNQIDKVWCGDAEILVDEIQIDPVDTLFCFDILEHLKDPWTALEKYANFLKPSGTVVISLPNIQYYKVALPLLISGRFEYEDAGVMDRTHLRWFVHKTALELAEGAGFQVIAFHHLVKLKPWRLKWIIDRLTFGRLRDLMAPQFLIIGRKI